MCQESALADRYESNRESNYLHPKKVEGQTLSSSVPSDSEERKENPKGTSEESASAQQSEESASAQQSEKSASAQQQSSRRASEKGRASHVRN